MSWTEAFQPGDVALTDILGSLLNLKHFSKASYLGLYLILQSNSSCQSLHSLKWNVVITTGDTSRDTASY